MTSKRSLSPIELSSSPIRKKLPSQAPKSNGKDAKSLKSEIAELKKELEQRRSVLKDKTNKRKEHEIKKDLEKAEYEKLDKKVQRMERQAMENERNGHEMGDYSEPDADDEWAAGEKAAAQLMHTYRAKDEVDALKE